MQRRGIPIVLVILVAAPIAFAQEPSENFGTNAAAQCTDLRTLPAVGPVCPRENGLYEVYAPDGRSLGFTHGADTGCVEDCPLPAEDVSTAGSTSPHCVNGAAGEYFIHVIYARASNDADRYATMVGTIRTLVGQANAMVDDAAIATGDRLGLRVKCASGVIVVENEVLPTSRTSATFSTVVNDLQNRGYNDDRQKYWVYYDDVASDCSSCAGVGHIYGDDSDSVNNLNNGPSSAVPMFAVSFNSASVRTMLHELGHNLGAVQNSAPRSSGAGHCTDGRDTMCYDDNGPNSGQCQPDFSCSSVCSVEVFDCQKNTYCHANPAAGSYLDTHWQACHRQTRFLQYADNVAPTMTAFSCAPTPSYAEETVSCTFSASDPNVGVFYRIDWGDGSTSRVPATGTVAPGTTQSATHVYTAQGSRTVRVNATDTGTPALTSTDSTFAHSVLAANVAPVASIASCSPAAPSEGQLVTCSFSSSDIHNVSYQVKWDDGTASVRVPSSGVVPAANAQTASHTYTRGGAFVFNVTATDDGRPAKSGSATLVLNVAEVNTAPVMASLACTPTTLRPAATINCNFLANDDTSGIRYDVQWGDGLTTVVPASGCTAPGVTQSAAHQYSSQGNYTLRVSATDCFSPPATSGVLTSAITVLNDISPPTLVVDDPRLGRVYMGCDDGFSKVTGRPLYVGRGCVRATATDPAGVARVEVREGTRLIATDTTAPYELEFDIPLFQQGVGYSVRAIDTFGFFTDVFFAADTIGG